MARRRHERTTSPAAQENRQGPDTNLWRGITARLVELLDESREIRRDGRCERVILVPERSPNRIKRDVSVAGAINVAWSGSTVNNMPTYPVSRDS
jgi:hypothetical protein